MKQMETINKLFLELSQVATADTASELDMRSRITQLQDERRGLQQVIIEKNDNIDYWRKKFAESQLDSDKIALNSNLTDLRNNNLRYIRTIQKLTAEHREEVARMKRVHAEEMRDASAPIDYSTKERDALEQIYAHVERVLGYEERRG